MRRCLSSSDKGKTRPRRQVGRARGRRQEAALRCVELVVPDSANVRQRAYVRIVPALCVSCVPLRRREDRRLWVLPPRVPLRSSTTERMACYADEGKARCGIKAGLSLFAKSIRQPPVHAHPHRHDRVRPPPAHCPRDCCLCRSRPGAQRARRLLCLQ